MLKNYFVKQGLLAIVFALCFLSTFPKFETLEKLAQPIWCAFVFINALFVILYFIANESLKTKTHKEFIAVFAVLFSVKIGTVLAWLTVAVFVFHLRNNAYILTFFALYLSYTFLFAVQIFGQTRK